jgi:hypothetical protein
MENPMAKKTRRTADDFVRDVKAKRAGDVPPTHNSGLPALTKAESACVERALDSVKEMRKTTFGNWVTIGRALKALHIKAEQLKLKKAYNILREREGLGVDIIKKSRSSRLLKIIDNLPEVEKWRATLTDAERFDWASPEAVHRHCPLFAKDAAPRSQTINSMIKKLVDAMDGKAPAEREQVAAQVCEALEVTTLRQQAA